tara:strand:+ start:1366 stop:1536 length:171 start_codon:yes stop_codon:yes gene_type:complete
LDESLAQDVMEAISTQRAWRRFDAKQEIDDNETAQINRLLKAAEELDDERGVPDEG